MMGRVEVIDGTSQRIRILAGGFAALILAVLVRLAATEMSEGAEYREVAEAPIERRQTEAALRGKILSRDGAILAYDQPIVSLAVHYRWLEEPANPAWLRRTARSRLSVAERRDHDRVAAAQRLVLAERRDLAARLQSLCGMTESQWLDRTRRIQDRVEKIAGDVNRRHRTKQGEAARADRFAEEEVETTGIGDMIKQSVLEALFADDNPLPSPLLTVVEELSEHVVFEGLPLEKVAEIESQPEKYPGVKLVHSYRRSYLQGELLSHVVGYLGKVNEKELESRFARLALHTSNPAIPMFRYTQHGPDDWLGRAGIEAHYESLLGSRRGLRVDQLDHRGNVLQSTVIRKAVNGTDLTVCIDTRLQRTAETVLDQALARRLPGSDLSTTAISGGAAIVMNIHSGEILAIASAPRFDPNDFIAGNERATSSLDDPARPLFDRAIQMALPPGSVFKIVSALAILDVGIDPLKPVDCQGYLHQPDALRCAIFRRLGVGHGPVTLIDALARSCNVYFFHYAEQIGSLPFLACARKFGFGEKTGIDLPGEVAGQLPGFEMAGHKSQQSAIDPRAISIGQSTITVTPLQVVCMMAEVANGGYKVQPRLVLNDAQKSLGSLTKEASRIDANKLEVIRQGLRQVVTDSQGTAHEILGSAVVSVSGKTGTAQTGLNRPDHAWFAGYAPADDPQVAFVVVLEHAGDGATASGVVVKHLLERLHALGYLSKHAE